jgi:hypothetical protein
MFHQYVPSLFSWIPRPQLQLIFQSASSQIDTYFIYAHRFDIIPQSVSLTNHIPHGMYPDPLTGMYVLKHAQRADGTHVGGIVELSHLRIPVELIPHFSEHADTRLTPQNSLECSVEFLLNKYSDKEVYALIF